MVHEASHEENDAAPAFRRAWLLPELETADVPARPPALGGRLAPALEPAATAVRWLLRTTDDLARSFPLLELFAVAALMVVPFARAFLN